MSVISMKQLLEAGVHFGHQTRRWNPKMAPYIFTERNGIHIIDLQKAVGKVDEAYKAISDIANGRGARNLFEKVVTQQAKRTVVMSDKTDDLSTSTEEDVINALEQIDT